MAENAQAPAVMYRAIGHGREVDLSALGVPALLTFVGRTTSDQAQPISATVREIYPDVARLVTCNIADVRGIPKLLRRPVEMLMKSSYNDAVATLKPGQRAEDAILILPDWDGTCFDAFGIDDVGTTVAVGVLDASGRIIGTYQGDDAAAQALKLLRQVAAGG